MKNGWDRLRGRAEGLLGLDRLTETFRTFVLLHFGFLIFNNLQTVFINTLFFRLTGGADTTLQYNLITYVFNPIGTTLAMYYASKKGSTKAMRLGFFTFIFFCKLKFYNFTMIGKNGKQCYAIQKRIQELFTGHRIDVDESGRFLVSQCLQAIKFVEIQTSKEIDLLNHSGIV